MYVCLKRRHTSRLLYAESLKAQRSQLDLKRRYFSLSSKLKSSLYSRHNQSEVDYTRRTLWSLFFPSENDLWTKKQFPSAGRWADDVWTFGLITNQNIFCICFVSTCLRPAMSVSFPPRCHCEQTLLGTRQWNMHKWWADFCVVKLLLFNICLPFILSTLSHYPHLHLICGLQKGKKKKKKHLEKCGDIFQWDSENSRLSWAALVWRSSKEKMTQVPPSPLSCWPSPRPYPL